MPGGRPPSPSTPTMPGECPVHGAVTLRGHSRGRTTRDGEPALQWTCSECRAQTERDRRAQARRDRMLRGALY